MRSRPYLSAQSFLGAETATGAYYTDIADALRAHALEPRAQLTELFRRMLFTILVSNNDDHLKNHGLSESASRAFVLESRSCRNPTERRLTCTRGVSLRKAFC